ncbi:MAG: alpha/beta hydrolase [Chloroflexi bacterium]|nr:alpha/beta hydrolase [Chloroflexota bacterium]
MTNPIPFHDFGGNGPLLHFAAPNAYTPECFHQFISPFLDHFHVISMIHRPLWHGSSPDELVGDWHVFADDLIAFFEQQALHEVIAIGHSLGGVATTYASVKRPELFKKLVLVDPVFLPVQLLQMARLYPEKVAEQHPLLARTLRRKNRWSSRQAAYTHFRNRSVFEQWPDASIEAYVNYALREEPESGDIILCWPREWEARIYSILPQGVWDAIAQVAHPTLAIRAAKTDTLFPPAWDHWQVLQPHATFVELPDVGHMMMMERPLLVAQTILDYLQR